MCSEHAAFARRELVARGDGVPGIIYSLLWRGIYLKVDLDIGLYFGMYFSFSNTTCRKRGCFGWVPNQAAVAQFHNLYNFFVLSSFCFCEGNIFS